MPDWPLLVPSNRATIQSASPEACGTEIRMANGAGACWVSAVWPAANRAIFVPFIVYKPYTAKKMSVENGATVNGNVDAGIYTSDGTRIVSIGSTAQAGASVIQEFNITDTLLLPGQYYMAFAMSSGTATNKSCACPQLTLAAAGLYQMASALALPATATFATMSAGVMPNIAVHGRVLV